MSLISEIKVELTAEQKIMRVEQGIRKSSKRLYNMIESQHRSIFNTIWENKRATPQEVLDGYGAEAMSLFVFSNDIQTLLKTANPEYVLMTAPYDYTINPDGTVTIGDERGDVS